MYWVEWNTLKARPARKSRDESKPATGRSWKPVHSEIDNMDKKKIT